MDTTVDLSGLPVTTDAPVLVTGASGYVAGWLVKALLDAGVTVHAAVRRPDDQAKVAHLLEAAQASPGTLRLFAADLLTEGSYAPAMDGCRVVWHTASPFVREVKDAQRDLVDPARLGTRNVLETATRTPSVERVVVTSSIAAMYTDAAELDALPGGMLDESVWNTTASLRHEPYNYSKTLAEREAWRIADAQNRWRLVVVNPSFVIGPALAHRTPTSESFAIMRQLLGGDLRFGAPRLAMSCVDVRDLARAHVAAGFVPDAEGRHLVSGHDTDLYEMGRALAPRFGDRYPLPGRVLPKAVMKAVGPLFGASRAFVDGNVGHPLRCDTTKARDALGMTRYRPLAESLVEMAEQMDASGALAKRGRRG